VRKLSEPTNREFDVAIALARLETKLDWAMESRSKAEEADKKAEQAIALANENARDISQLSTTIKWAVGIISSVVLGIAGLVVTIVF
jgi:hypothetical protein